MNTGAKVQPQIVQNVPPGNIPVVHHQQQVYHQIQPNVVVEKAPVVVTQNQSRTVSNQPHPQNVVIYQENSQSQRENIQQRYPNSAELR